MYPLSSISSIYALSLFYHINLHSLFYYINLPFPFYHINLPSLFYPINLPTLDFHINPSLFYPYYSGLLNKAWPIFLRLPVSPGLHVNALNLPYEEQAGWQEAGGLVG